MEKVVVEFTDRYGGQAPSWLRGCHAGCEATGWLAPAEYEGEFTPCPACGGTGRCSWRQTITLLPRWLWKGQQFIWELIRHPEMLLPSQRALWCRVWWGVRCAYLADLGLWRP